MARGDRQRHSQRPAPAQQAPAPAADKPQGRRGEIRSSLQTTSDWQQFMTRYEPQIRAAFPKLVRTERLIRVALTAMQRNPALFKCTGASVLGCLIQSAQLGLDLDPVVAHAYMVPYANNKRIEGQWQKVLEAQLQIGYQGLMELARRSGTIGDIRAQAVYDGDFFEYETGTTTTIRHVPFEMARRKGLTQATERGHLYAVYTVVRTKDESEKSVHVMWRGEIDAIRGRSRAKDDGPWVTDYEAMCKKTVIRQHCKFLPRSVELATAVTLDELNDANLPQNLGLLPFADDPAVAAEYEESQRSAQEELSKAEASPSPATPAQPQDNPREDLLAQIQEAINAMGSGELIDNPFDEACARIAKELKIAEATNLNAWPIEGLNVLLVQLRGLAEARKKEGTPDAVPAQSQ